MWNCSRLNSVLEDPSQPLSRNSHEWQRCQEQEPYAFSVYQPTDRPHKKDPGGTVVQIDVSCAWRAQNIGSVPSGSSGIGHLYKTRLWNFSSYQFDSPDTEKQSEVPEKTWKHTQSMLTTSYCIVKVLSKSSETSIA